MNTRLLFALLCLLPLCVYAQWDRDLGQILPELDNPETSDAYLIQIGHFQKLSKEYPDAWLPSYYEGLSRFRASYVMHKEGYFDERESQLDTAQWCVDQALAAGGDTSEIYVLQGLIYQGRIWGNPMVKGPSFSSKSIHILKEAIAMNSSNPRAPHMIGQLLFHLPTFLGGGMETAKPMLEEAIDKYQSFEPACGLHPSWGYGDARQLLATIRQNLEN